MKQRFFALHVGDQLGMIKQRTQGGQARSAADRVTAESGDVAQYGVVGEQVGHTLSCDEGAQGHSPAEALGQQQNVGHHAILLEGEEGSRTPHSRLDLVEDEQGPHLVATLPNGLQPFWPGLADAPLGLHGLQYYGGGPFRDAVEAVIAVEVEVADTGEQWVEGLGKIFGPLQAGRALGAAVVGAFGADDLGAAGGALGQFHGPLGGLRPRVDEIDTVQAFGQLAGHQGRQLCLRGQHKLPVNQGMHVPTGLILHRFHHRRMVVPQAGYADTCNKVEVALTVGIFEVNARTTGDLQAHGGGAGLGYVGEEVGAVGHSQLSVIGCPLLVVIPVGAATTDN